MNEITITLSNDTLHLLAGELGFIRRELAMVTSEIQRWADADAERYEYEYCHPSAKEA